MMDCVVQGYLTFLLGSGIFIGLVFVVYVLYVLNKLVKNKGEIKQFSSPHPTELPGFSHGGR
ncbi:p6 protein [Fig virus A]|nr:p6 protein [Fig virus A]